MPSLWPRLPFLLNGLLTTAELFAIAAAAGTVLALVIAAIRTMRVPVLARACAVFVGLMRGMPLLAVLFVCYFALPAAFGYQTTAFAASSLGFTLFTAAYIAEDMRAAVLSVRPSLTEAALALGLTRFAAMRLIVFPIAARQCVPPLFGQYVRLFKFTSVASIIGVADLTGSAVMVNARLFQPFILLGFIAACYLVACLSLSLLGRLIHARLTRRMHA